MHKFCANCGNPVTIGQRFCTECGAVNASFEDEIQTPPLARVAILKELEEATLQKVDELRKLREYQQRIHSVPDANKDEESLRLQKLEMLVQIEEGKVDMMRKRLEQKPNEHEEEAKEITPVETTKPTYQETTPVAETPVAPIVEPTVEVSTPINKVIVEAPVPPTMDKERAELERILATHKPIEHVAPIKKHEELPPSATKAMVEHERWPDSHSMERKPYEKPTILPLSFNNKRHVQKQAVVPKQKAVAATPPPTTKSVSVNQPMVTAEPIKAKPIPRLRKTGTRRTISRNAIAAAALVIIGLGAFGIAGYLRQGNFNALDNTVITHNTSIPKVNTNNLVQANAEEPIADNTPAKQTLAAIPDNVWQKLATIKSSITHDLNNPQYDSLGWLIAVHSKLLDVDFAALAKQGDNLPVDIKTLNPLIKLSDSIQWNLLKYCYDHTTALADRATYMVLINGNEEVNINEMYPRIADPELKRQAEVFYKQAVIRYNRANEERQRHSVADIR